MLSSTAEVRRRFGFDDRWFVALGAPALGVLIPAVFFGKSPLVVGWAAFAPYFAISTLYALTYWLLCRGAIAYWRRRVPSLGRAGRRIAYSTLTVVALVVAVELFCAYAFGWESVLRLFLDFEKDAVGGGSTFGTSLIFSLAMTGVYEAVFFLQRTRRAEVERERLLRSQIETQLNALRKQIDPHFLFNSLNTLATIIPEDTAASVAFTQRLSAAYRRLLEWRHAATVTVADELRALGDYNYLLAVRFEGRLHVDIDVPPELHARRIVPLALQTLVENAVKHNVTSSAHPLRVRIWAEGTVIEVCNGLSPKPAKRLAEESTGLGLQNLGDAVRYLDHGELVIAEADGEFCVSVPTGEPEGVAARPPLADVPEATSSLTSTRA